MHESILHWLASIYRLFDEKVFTLASVKFKSNGNLANSSNTNLTATKYIECSTHYMCWCIIVLWMDKLLRMCKCLLANDLHGKAAELCLAYN